MSHVAHSPASGPERPAPPSSETLDHGATVDHLRRARAGQESSWQPLSGKIGSFLLRCFGRCRLPLGNQVEDLQQHVTIKLFEALPDFEVRSRQEFWSYIHTVATHIIVDWQRRERTGKRDRAREIEASDHDGAVDLVDTLPGSEPAPDEKLLVAELDALEKDCLLRVATREQQEVYRLRRVEQLDFATIGARLGGRRSVVTIRWMYMKTRQQVQNALRRRLDSAYGGLLERLGE